jgi:imidazolonepropionase-like amidohydrolase
VAITGATVATGTAMTPVEGRVVLISGGRARVLPAGAAPPPGARIVEARGGWVTPGLFAGFSRLGLVEVDAVDQTNDTAAERAPYQAALDVAPAINPRGVNIAINRADGVTRAAVAPSAGKEIFAGRGALIQTGGERPAVFRQHAFQYVELGERGARLAGGSRTASFLHVRNALAEAADYVANGFRYRMGGHRDSELKRVDLEALIPVVRGEQPLLVRAERAQDILNVLALKREFTALRPVLVGAGEGWTVAREIAAAGVPVIAMALPNLPDRFETLAATQSNVPRMIRAGVTVALGLIDENDARQLRLLPQEAGNLVALSRVPGATGLTHAEALATITSAPAKIFGYGDLGYIPAGPAGSAVGDVVLWSGDPLELSSTPLAVFVEGVEQPLGNRQDRLRDRYLGLQRGDATLHYRRP